MTASSQWRYAGAFAGGPTSFTGGLPSALTLTGSSTPSGGGSSGTWTLSGNALVPAGTYTVRVTISDAQGGSTFRDVVITISQEDALIFYSGDTLKSTGSTASNSTTTLNLAAVIKEDLVDGNVGSKLNTTQLKFSVYKFTDMTTAVATCTGNVVATGSGTGSASCSPPYLFGADNYIVKIELLTNGYYTSPVEDQAVTVTIAGTGFTTGGGWFNEPNLGTRSNFGFTVKYLKNGNIQGNSLYIYRKTLAAAQVINGVTVPAGQYNWIIKSNAMSGLQQYCTTATPIVCQAQFTGKNNITAVNRSTGVAYSLGGNYNFQVDVTDASEPGSGGP